MALLAVAPALQAQMSAPTRFVSWRPDALERAVQVVSPDSTTAKGSGSGMVIGGIGGTLIGWITGAFAGAAFTQDRGEDAEWDGVIYGAMVGATVVIPLGVHLGNHEQGNLLNDLLVSSAIGVAGIALTSASQSGIPFLLTPLAQVIATAWMEDRAMRKAAQGDASL